MCKKNDNKEFKKALKQLIRGDEDEHKEDPQEWEKILPEINDMPKLMKYWDEAPDGSEAQKLIEARIKEILSETNDMSKLMEYCADVPSNSEAEKLIEARMKEILESLTLSCDKDIPEWFADWVCDPGKIPDFLRKEFVDKCKSLI